VFIKRTTKRLKGKTYFNHLLVESVATDKGPRHRVVCSLGSLEPAPPKEWRALARRMEEALDEQQALLIDKPLAALPEPGREGFRARRPRVGADSGEFDLEGLEFEQCREAGPVHVGHQMWERLGLDQILSQAGLSDDAQLLSQLMTLNRLIAPRSELAMSEWIRRTALADIVQKDFSALNEDRLYRNLDKLYPRRSAIEAQLVERERTLFGLKETIYLYDLTSTYFEGQALANPKAMRGYSRDKRPDCKQVVVGLVLDSEGFPKAHEVFAGNRPDSTTVAEMLRALEKRTGKVPGATVVVDRGMADSENLAAIRSAGYHYLVAGQQVGRGLYQEQFEAEENWQEIEREPSPRNPSQKKVRVFVKAAQAGEGEQELYRAVLERRPYAERPCNPAKAAGAFGTRTPEAPAPGQERPPARFCQDPPSHRTAQRALQPSRALLPDQLCSPGGCLTLAGRSFGQSQSPRIGRYLPAKKQSA